MRYGRTLAARTDTISVEVLLPNRSVDFLNVSLFDESRMPSRALGLSAVMARLRRRHCSHGNVGRPEGGGSLQVDEVRTATVRWFVMTGLARRSYDAVLPQSLEFIASHFRKTLSLFSPRRRNLTKCVCIAIHMDGTCGIHVSHEDPCKQKRSAAEPQRLSPRGGSMPAPMRLPASSSYMWSWRMTSALRPERLIARISCSRTIGVTPSGY